MLHHFAPFSGSAIDSKVTVEQFRSLLLLLLGISSVMQRAGVSD